MSRPPARQLAGRAARTALRHTPVGRTLAVLAGLASLGAPLFILLVAASSAGGVAEVGRRAGIPGLALAAYLTGSQTAQRRDCQLAWPVLAGIGQVESHHGQPTPTARITAAGQVTPPIIGPPLDGTDGRAHVADTDGGRLDGDPQLDRAVGPMQLLPATWQQVAVDASGDQQADPHNFLDAAAGAAVFLCQAAGGQLTTPTEVRTALHAYNPSGSYVEEVLGWISLYQRLRHRIPAASTAGGRYTLPVAQQLVSPAQLVAAHHDYPAWDLGLPVSTPVVAAHGGQVSATTAGGRCGRGVEINGDDGHTYRYCHAQQVKVATGQTVAAGELILLSGNTGRSTAPHLHLAIQRPDGTRVCPQDVLIAWYRGQPAPPTTARTSGCTTPTGTDTDRPNTGTARTPAGEARP